jgi:hypothetical protein
MDPKLAKQVIESLRKGVPPQRGVDQYSVGNEKLIAGVKRFHLSAISDVGIIRFVSGSWGAGKTHFFRLLRDVAFQSECLVSNVELNVNDAPLNKFELVFYSIVRNIATPSYYAEGGEQKAAPFSTVLGESLAFLSNGTRTLELPVAHEHYVKAIDALMANAAIDIDFKKIVQEYWKTFLPDAGDPTLLQQTREEILQWFSGEGQKSAYQRKYGINKMINRQDAKLMLQSLAAFVRLSGYKGLLILFDEAEQAYSIMRKSALRAAHDNLLSLINNIENSRGLFLIYATTLDFFTDPTHGIVVYGALSGRVGKPDDKPPKALDIIWNLDAVQPELPEYQQAAAKVAALYRAAYGGETGPAAAAEGDLGSFVSELYRIHPSLSAVRFWRVLVTALIKRFDDELEGEVRPVAELYRDVMKNLRED